MRQSFKRLMSSVLALTSVVLAFVLYFNFVQPEYKTIMELRGELASLSELLESQRSIMQAVNQLAQKYNESEDARAQVALALPTSPMSAEALAQLHGIAAVNNLAAQAYVLQAPPQSSDRDREAAGFELHPAKPLVFEVRAAGSYEDFKKFLNNLETNVRIFDLEALSLSASSKANQNLYIYDLRIAAYYQDEEEKE